MRSMNGNAYWHTGQETLKNAAITGVFLLSVDREKALPFVDVSCISGAGLPASSAAIRISYGVQIMRDRFNGARAICAEYSVPDLPIEFHRMKNQPTTILFDFHIYFKSVVVSPEAPSTIFISEVTENLRIPVTTRLAAIFLYSGWPLTWLVF